MSLKITQYDSSKLPQIEEVQDLYVALKNYTNNFTEKLTDSTVIKQDQELIEILELLDFDFEAAKVKGGKDDDYNQFNLDIYYKQIIAHLQATSFTSNKQGREKAETVAEAFKDDILREFKAETSYETAASIVYGAYKTRLENSVKGALKQQLNFSDADINAIWKDTLYFDFETGVMSGQEWPEITETLIKKHKLKKQTKSKEAKKIDEWRSDLRAFLIKDKGYLEAQARKIVLKMFRALVANDFKADYKLADIEKTVSTIHKANQSKLITFADKVLYGVIKKFNNTSKGEKAGNEAYKRFENSVEIDYYDEKSVQYTATAIFDEHQRYERGALLDKIKVHHGWTPAQMRDYIGADEEAYIFKAIQQGYYGKELFDHIMDKYQWYKEKKKHKKSFSQYVDDVKFILAKKFENNFSAKERVDDIVSEYKDIFIKLEHEKGTSESEVAKQIYEMKFELIIDRIARSAAEEINVAEHEIITWYLKDSRYKTDLDRFNKGDNTTKIAAETVKYIAQNFKKETPKPKTKPTPKMDNKLQALQIALAQLMEDADIKSGVKEEDVKNIIKAFMDKYKISEAQLDEELRVKINNVRKIKIATPKFESKSFGTEDENPNLLKIIDDIMLGHAVMFIGGAGTGKTHLAEKVADKILGRGFNTINCSQWTSPVEIIGGETIEGFKEGKLIDAWKNGKILILDELPKIDPNTAGLLNEALAKIKEKSDGSTQYIQGADGKKHAKHKDFGVMATGNVYPNTESIAYGANNKQDLSLLDRFSGSVYFIEKNPKFEKTHIGLMIWSICDKLRSVIETNKYEAQMSLRFMQVARDTYNVEMARVNGDAGKDAPDANEGKTLKAAIDSFLSTFTDAQIKVLKTAINYSKNIENYQYRKADHKNLLIK